MSSARVRFGERVGGGPAPARPRLRLTLRAKGFIALLVLAFYEGGVWLYASHERARLLHTVQQIEHTSRVHELLMRANDGLVHSIVALQEVLPGGDRLDADGRIAQDVAAVSVQLPELKATFPGLAGPALRLEQLAARIGPASDPEFAVDLRDAEQTLAAQVVKLESELQQQERSLTRHYQDLNHRLTLALLIANLLGLGAFGAVATIFFSRLASDIRQLEAQALAVAGDEAAKLREMSRRDEVGGLQRAIDWMQDELQRREHLREISRQQSFHQEKMAAIGSVATTLAHEIGNPINSISGIAQHTIDAVRSGRPPAPAELAEHAGLTLRQTERIGAIVRQLSDLSSPRPQEPELLNLNELIHTTCSFVRYDKRFRRATLVTELDRGLPAVFAVNDHLTQVLMNLLINAADAFEGVEGRAPAIRVSTRCHRDRIEIEVHDNGQGMAPNVLGQAFEQSFTTKPAARGRGIGLYLCRKLIQDIGGGIELESANGIGTTARVFLPLPALALPEAA